MFQVALPQSCYGRYEFARLPFYNRRNDRIIWRWNGAVATACIGGGGKVELRLVRLLDFRGFALLGAAALGIALPGSMMSLAGSARAETALEERKLPMKFSWVVCDPNCRGWVSAVGIVTSDSPADFDRFARGRDLNGATVVLDSSGGSVNDAIALGRRWRNLGLLTTVGTSIETIPRKAIRPASCPMPIAS